jgi:hypothetical protein
MMYQGCFTSMDSKAETKFYSSEPTMIVDSAACIHEVHLSITMVNGLSDKDSVEALCERSRTIVAISKLHFYIIRKTR